MASSIIKSDDNFKIIQINTNNRSVHVNFNRWSDAACIVFGTMNDNDGFAYLYANGYITPIHESNNITITHNRTTWRDTYISYSGSSGGCVGVIHPSNLVVTLTNESM